MGEDKVEKKKERMTEEEFLEIKSKELRRQVKGSLESLE